ncbi:MAG: class I SAM-dependent methyltransferase [Nanoarchaeota archaeon]|nr:class I SAM-dependent methyltransferase [Nanoarchaeota archaeon]
MKSTKQYYQKTWNLKSIKRLSKSEPFRKEEPDIELKRFLSYLNKKRIRGDLLDVGCGAGRHSILFAKKGFNVTGFDYSSNAIKLAKRFTKKYNLDINFKVANVLSYKSRKKFDVIIDYGCLHHLPKSEWLDYRKTLLNQSKIGTLIFLFAFSENSRRLHGYYLKKKQKSIIINGEYTYFLSLNEIKKLFSKEFKIVFLKEKKTIDKLKSFWVVYLLRMK